jgi:hypothetical protein
MSISVLFVCGLLLTAVVSLSVMAYVQGPLRRILVELCGTDERAHFWMVFSNVTVVVVSLMAALQYRPEPAASSPALIEVASQLKWGLAGLAISMLALGRNVRKAIPHPPANVPTPVPKTLVQP